MTGFRFHMTAAVLIAAVIAPINLMALSVSFYIGDVSALRENKKINIAMGTQIQGGDVIRTGDKSSVELLYEDGSKITVLEKSTVRVGSPSVKGDDNVSLISGNITGKFEKLKKGSRKVYTPTTICAIRGTEFTVSVSDGGDSRVDLAEGKLDLNNPYGSMELNPGEKADSIVSHGPGKLADESSAEDWQAQKNSEFRENPEDKGSQYDTYLSSFRERSKDSGKSVGAYASRIKKARDKEALEKTGKDIDTAEETIRDDLFLNEASNATIENIMNDFEARGDSIYRKFKTLKEESNKVLEQQKKNYEAIQAVREAHRQAYEKIMGKFQDDKNRIFNNLNKDDVKPRIKNDEE